MKSANIFCFCGESIVPPPAPPTAEEDFEAYTVYEKCKQDETENYRNSRRDASTDRIHHVGLRCVPLLLQIFNLGLHNCVSEVLDDLHVIHRGFHPYECFHIPANHLHGEDLNE